MNRRSFLRTLPIFCSVPQLCQALGMGAKRSERFVEGLQFFRSVNYNGQKEFLAFEDLWDSAFQAKCQRDLEEFYRTRTTHGKVKISTSDSVPLFELTQARYEREMDWVSFTRQLAPHAPGKKQYVSFLLNRYDYNLGLINRRYGSEAKRLTDLLEHPFIKIDLQDTGIFGDDTAFLQVLARKWSIDLQKNVRSIAKHQLELNESEWAQGRPFQIPTGRQSRFAIL